MYRRKYIIFLVVFLSVFSMTFVSGNATCKLFGVNVMTENNDPNIIATDTENFNIKSDITWTDMPLYWKFNITTNVPQNYVITPDTKTVTCLKTSSYNFISINEVYYTYEGLNITQIHCEYKTTNSLGTTSVYTNFTTNTTSIPNNQIGTWDIDYRYGGTYCNVDRSSGFWVETTTILAPLLQIKSLEKYPDGWWGSPFYAYINTNFRLDISAKNTLITGSNTGKAFGVYSNITYNETAFTNQSGCNPTNISYGDIESGDENWNSCNFSANTLGFYNFNTILFDWTGNYTYNNFTNLSVVNLTVSGYAESPQYYGGDTTIYAVVAGNASEIDSVTAIWNYTYINESSNEINIGTSNCTMYLYEVLGPTNHKYICTRQFLDSGDYNITFNVTDYYGMDTITATNTTEFMLPFGYIYDVNAWFNNNEASPIILKNQTFNITIGFIISQGDIWDLNLTLNTSNNQTLNITDNPFLSIGNLKNGTSLNATWAVYANNTDIVQLTITANHTDGTSSIDEYLRVVDVISVVKNSTLNITEGQNITLKIAGNLSELLKAKLQISKEYSGFEYTPENINYNVVPIEECYSLSEDSQNIATLSHGAYATSGGGIGTNNKPNNTIDENDGTMWYGFSGYDNPTELNITFNGTYSLKSLELLWDDDNKISNISIYYVDKSDTSMKWLPPEEGEPTINWKLLVTNINAPNTTNRTVISKPIFTNKIKIVQNSNLTALNIYSVNATTITQESQNQSCYIFNFNYSNTTRSGNYNVSCDVTLNKSMANRINANEFFINYGYPSIDFGATTRLLGQQNYTPIITAVNGDLRNITLNISFSNLTIFNLSSGENISKNIDFIFYDTSKNTTWDLNSSESGFVNLTLTANSTSNQGSFVNNTEEFQTVSEDTNPPIVNAFWFEYNITNKTNLMTDFIIYANITDAETYIKNATATVYYPSGGYFSKTQTETISGGTNDPMWKIVLNDKLNETGNYTVKISAYDFLSNYNESGDIVGPKNRSFNVTNIYHFAPIAYNTYNRGENIIANLLDINNNSVTNANWTVNLTKYGGNETAIRTGIIYNDDYSYEIKTNDTDGNYSIFANASKNKNYVYSNHTFSFNASSNLLIYLNTTFDSEYDSNANLPYFTSSVYTIRNVELIDTTTTLNYNSYIEYMNYISGLFRSLTQYKAPATSNTIKTLTINASDTNNNTGILITNIKTKATTPPPGGGGGSSSSSSGSIPTPITITENKTPIINFDYVVENNEREFIQGYPDTVVATITNTGELPLIIYTKTSPSQIDITIDNNFTLDVGADKSFKITLYANLSINPGIYYADIILYNENLNLKKTRTLKMIVNENEYISDFKDLKEDLDLFELEIVSFENVKINTSSIRKHTVKIQQYLSDANVAIKNDKMETLQFSVDNARSELDDAKLKALPLKTTQFIFENKWALLSGGITTLVLLYILFYLIIPYSKISNRIRKLTRLEKIIIDTRKATEKKYFMRQLNEMTFNKIMADEENKLLKFKSEVNKLKQEKHLLVHLQLGKIKHLEDDKKKEKERIKKEIDLKEKSKRKMSDIIVEHDMNKKKSILEYFGYNKKRKEFVFDNTTQKQKTDIVKSKEKTSLFSKFFKSSSMHSTSSSKQTISSESKTNISDETTNKNTFIKREILENNSKKDETVTVDAPPVSVINKSNNTISDSSNTKNISNKDNMSNINEQSIKKKEEKTLYSTNNKENIKEEIKKIKKMLRG